jgi:O-acetyl-ADP-ribose deacetylase (regulator of RNase III)
MCCKEINGSIFDVGAQVIVHQVNCMGVMGSGVAKQVRDRFPSVFLAYHNAVKTLDHNCLGGCLVVEAKENPGLRIANLFGQYYYRGFKEDDLYLVDEFWKQPEIDKQTVKAIRFTNYEAFWSGLVRLKEVLREDETKIAFPYKIGSDRGGADWEVLKEMIKSVFKDTNKEIIICKI